MWVNTSIILGIHVSYVYVTVANNDIINMILVFEYRKKHESWLPFGEQAASVKIERQVLKSIESQTEVLKTERQVLKINRIRNRKYCKPNDKCSNQSNHYPQVLKT